MLHKVPKPNALEPVRSYPGFGVDKSGHLLALPGFVNLEHSGANLVASPGYGLGIFVVYSTIYKLKGKERP